jgi:ATP phosphoribosyltransferase regulatory subunit HisZ
MVRQPYLAPVVRVQAVMAEVLENGDQPKLQVPLVHNLVFLRLIQDFLLNLKVILLKIK